MGFLFAASMRFIGSASISRLLEAIGTRVAAIFHGILFVRLPFGYRKYKSHSISEYSCTNIGLCVMRALSVEIRIRSSHPFGMEGGGARFAG